MKMISRRSFLKGAGVAAFTATAAACSSAPSSSAAASSSSEAAGTDYAELLAEFDEVAACVDDWGNTFDAAIQQIYQEADLAKRAQLMHEAEDMVMKSYGTIPLYFYVDTYLQKEYVTGMINTVFGMKQFGYCDNTNNNNESLNICLASEPDYLDCRLSSSVDGGCMNTQLYAGLMGTSAEGKTIPSCATGYELDGKTYTFTLRDDLKWSDGEKLDAHDFVYSWNSTANPDTGASYGYLFDILAKNDDGTLAVEASEDGLTLTVTLGAVCPYFLDLCAFPAYFPVPEKHVEAAKTAEDPGAWAKEAGFVTNGPYKITAWNHNNSITLEKSETFFNADAIKIQKLNFMLSDQADVIFSAYNAGNLDISALVPVAEIAGLKGTAEFHIDPYLGTYYVSANVNSELFADMTTQQACACRKAIAISIDRQFICDQVVQAGQIPANCFVSSGCVDGNGNVFRANTDTYTYPWADENGENVGYFDPFNIAEEEALELFAAAGLTVKDGMVEGFSFEYLTNNDDAHLAIGEVIQSDMAAMGIDVAIDSQDWKIFLEVRKTGKYDIARNGWVMDFNDPINELEMWTTESGNNDIQFGR